MLEKNWKVIKNNQNISFLVDIMLTWKLCSIINIRISIKLC